MRWTSRLRWPMRQVKPGPTGFLAGLRNRPQPGAIDVRVAGVDDVSFVVGCFELAERVLDELVRALQTFSKLGTAWATPVDHHQRRLGEALQVWSRRVFWLEGFERVHQHAQIVVEL